MKETSYNKKGTFNFCMLNVCPRNLFRHLSQRLKCHFFIVITKKVRRNKMIAMSFSTLIIKVLVFMHQASSLSRELADTQQLNIPKLIIVNACL